MESLGSKDPYLGSIRDKIPILRVFATRVRDGRASRSGKAVRAGTVATELQAVGKGFTDVGITTGIMQAWDGDTRWARVITIR